MARCFSNKPLLAPVTTQCTDVYVSVGHNELSGSMSFIEQMLGRNQQSFDDMKITPFSWLAAHKLCLFSPDKKTTFHLRPHQGVVFNERWSFIREKVSLFYKMFTLVVIEIISDSVTVI